MAALQELMDENFQLLSKDDELEFGYKSMVLSSESEENGENSSIPMDMQIQAVQEQLAKVKHNERNLLTYELFLQRVLESKTLEDALPTSAELAQNDVLLAQEKVKLRAIKAARAEAEKDLAEAAKKLGESSSARNRVRSEFKDEVERAKAAVKVEVVKNVLKSGDKAEMEKLVANIDSYDANACELILRELAIQKSQCEKEAKEQANKTEEIELRAKTLEKEVSELEQSTKAMQATISENDKENSSHAAMRHECAMQEQLTEMLAALTGVRVSEVRSNGLTFMLNANVFTGKRESPPQSSHTHTLEVEFGSNEIGETVIAFMHLDPPDAEVSDIREELGMSLYTGVGKVCQRLRSRLCGFTERVPETPRSAKGM